MFNLPTQCDPEVLLKSGIAVATPADRDRVTSRLLEALESGNVTRRVLEIREYFDRLDSPGLAQILERYLAGRTLAGSARIAAIEIIRACKVSILQDNLVSIALDQTEAFFVRCQAASAVKDIGSSAQRGQLSALAFEPSGNDPRDDLKGLGLLAGWPEHLNSKQLFSALTEPQAENYIGYYRGFWARVSSKISNPRTWRLRSIGRDNLRTTLMTLTFSKACIRRAWEICRLHRSTRYSWFVSNVSS